MRQRTYLGSDLVIEQQLDPGRNYRRYVASYQSDGLKIYGLLTIPNGERPATGWPIIIFNHGYIPPTEYRTTERYVAYQDAFAAAGYITFKSDYRGHGSSQGRAGGGGFGNVDYTIDVLNALASVKRLKEADPQRIGLWGHSMGGSVTLRAMVTTREIKAGVIWAGVVASATDQFNRSRSTATASALTATPRPTTTAVATFTGGGRGTNALVAQYGSPEQNPAFWNSISPNSFLKDLGGPLQLHHGTADTSVPYQYSVTLEKQMRDAGGTVEFYTYQGDDHNIAQNLGVALARSVAFFDKYVKETGGK
jgi:dipeptidyl aminopeptidase/acylaminoacyl peptidase